MPLQLPHYCGNKPILTNDSYNLTAILFPHIPLIETERASLA